MLKLEYIVCIFCLGSFCRWLELALQQMLDCSIDLFFLFLRKTSEMTEDVFITNATNNFVVAVVCSKVNWVLILWVLVPVCWEMHTYSTSREIWLFFFFGNCLSLVAVLIYSLTDGFLFYFCFCMRYLDVGRYLPFKSCLKLNTPELSHFEVNEIYPKEHS